MGSVFFDGLQPSAPLNTCYTSNAADCNRSFKMEAAPPTSIEQQRPEQWRRQSNSSAVTAINNSNCCRSGELSDSSGPRSPASPPTFVCATLSSSVWLSGIFTFPALNLFITFGKYCVALSVYKKCLANIVIWRFEISCRVFYVLYSQVSYKRLSE